MENGKNEIQKDYLAEQCNFKNYVLSFFSHGSFSISEAELA